MTATQAAKARKRRIRAEVHQLIIEAKQVPCARCFFSFPSVCMDFDHLPAFTKEFNIGSPSNWTSVHRVKQEIAKCEVVCSNCHRIRTWERKNNRKVDYPETGQWPWQPTPEQPTPTKKRKSFKNLLTRMNGWDKV